MKRSSILFCISLLLASYPASACDFCNCLLGINPFYTTSDQFIVNFLYQRSSHDASLDDEGLFHSKPTHLDRYSYLAAPHLAHHDDSDYDGPVSESRSTFEFAYQHHFSDHIMATAILPVTLADIESDHHLSVRGIGDPMVLAHYVIPNLLSGSTPMTLLLGGGIKLPLGNHQRRDTDGDLLEPDLQPGSGSVDMVLNSTMTVQWQQWTLGLDLFGKINTENAEHYRFGNSLSVSSTINRQLYRDNLNLFALIGTVGVRGEAADKDQVDGIVDQTSGFTTGYASVGGQVVYKSLRLNMTVMIPVYQQRNSPSVSEDTRIVSGLRYEF